MLLGLYILAAVAIALKTPGCIVAENVSRELGMKLQIENVNKILWDVRQGLIWFATVVVGIGSIFHLVASFSLLTSTKTGLDPTKALEKLRFWRNTTIFFTIWEFFTFVFVPDLQIIAGLVLVIVLRVMSLRTVSGFEKTLEEKREAAKRVNVEAAVPLQINTNQ